MPTITSAQSGLASATTTWVGGVVPVVGDKVIIASGHTVEINGTFHWGDDTITGITVLGTIKASRTVSSLLTCRGDLFLSDGTPGGALDYGTEVDPIPASVITRIVLNESAVMAHNKYGIRSNSLGNGLRRFDVWGAPKRAVTALQSAVAISATSVPVADATGWVVGDFVAIAPNTAWLVEVRAITSITPGAGTSATLTFAGGLVEAHAAGRVVMNLTRNVRITSHLPETWRSHITLRMPVTHDPTRINIGPCTITLSGGGTTEQTAAVTLFHGTLASSYVGKIDGPVLTSFVSVTGSTIVHVQGARNMLAVSSGQQRPFSINSIYICLPGFSGLALIPQGGASFKVGTESFILGGLAAANIGFSQGPVECEYNGQIDTCQTMTSGAGITFYHKGGRYRNVEVVAQPLAGGLMTFEGGFFDTLFRTGDSMRYSPGALFPLIFKNCQFNNTFGISRANSGIQNTHPINTTEVLSKNNDSAVNERYTFGGRVHRDNTRTRRSTASICMASWYSVNVLAMPLTAKVQAGAVLRIKGAVWIESSYLPGDAPAIALSGTGLTTVNWSAPAVANAWHEFDLSITNVTAFTTDVTITLTARSNANTETARAWFDGVFADPWSGDVRHHGFEWLAQTALVADTRITLTEAAALALPVAVNHVTQTVTVTGALTARQVFEAVMADLAQTANIGRAVHVTSATGDSFETSYTVTTSGAGVVVGAYADATGRKVTITAPALISGSRVQLYDLTADTEIYNGVLPGTGLLLPVTWTADHTIRLRAEHATKLALQTVGVLSSSGLTYLDVQADDTVYAANNIDGATCTEFVADGTNLQVDINDPDGVTSVQRLYAWAQWYQTTAEGIASDFFGAITASDAASYQIDQALADIHLDNVQTTPVRVVGGYLARRDGSTVIATGSGSIQMDPGKAYVAGVDGLARESTVQAVLGVALG